MVYRVPELARDVRIAIDENKTSEALLAEEDIDTLSLNDIIHSKIAEAARKVVSMAPLLLVDGGVPFGDAVYWRGEGSGWILLPEDFLRLLLFKMSDWERPVYEAITAADARYGQQFSRYKGLRGTSQKPVVAIVSRAEGRALEFFSSKDETATVEQALYLPLPRVDKDGGIEIPERCYDGVVYETASLVLATLGQRELSAIMAELSKETMR